MQTPNYQIYTPMQISSFLRRIPSSTRAIVVNEKKSYAWRKYNIFTVQTVSSRPEWYSDTGQRDGTKFKEFTHVLCVSQNVVRGKKNGKQTVSFFTSTTWWISKLFDRQKKTILRFRGTRTLSNLTRFCSKNRRKPERRISQCGNGNLKSLAFFFLVVAVVEECSKLL